MSILWSAIYSKVSKLLKYIFETQKVLIFTLIFRYNMTQHIKTHFKTRGINSLANNPATLAAALAGAGRGSLENATIPEDVMQSMIESNQFDQADNDTNQYDEEMTDQEAGAREESQEVIDPC